MSTQRASRRAAVLVAFRARYRKITSPRHAELLEPPVGTPEPRPLLQVNARYGALGVIGTAGTGSH